MFWTRGKATTAAILAAAAIIAFLYLGGHLDTVLYRFGLNHNPCTHTASGGIACGSGIVGTPYVNVAGGGGSEGGGSGGSPNMPSAAGAVGSSVSNSAGGSANSVP
jgi:hypothetical protein